MEYSLTEEADRRKPISKDVYKKNRKKYFLKLIDFDIEIGPKKSDNDIEMILRAGLTEIVDIKEVAKGNIEIDEDFIINKMFDNDPAFVSNALNIMEMYGACAYTYDPIIYPDPINPEDKDPEKWYWSDLRPEDKEALKALSNGQVKGTKELVDNSFRSKKSDDN